LDAEKKLREAFKGYVSYVRGEKPFIFPFRIYPKNALVPDYKYYISGKKIEDDKRIKYTKIILCNMKNVQSNTYTYYLRKKIKEGKIKENIDNESQEDITPNGGDENEKKDMGLLYDLTKISNITFPISDNSNSNSNINNNSNNNFKSKSSEKNNLNTIGSFSKSSIDTDYDNGYGGYYKVSNIIKFSTSYYFTQFI
jgi:hypothetical protein